MVARAERITPVSSRSLSELTTFPEKYRANLVVCTDVEGPLFTGDFIAEAMSERMLPEKEALIAEPSYGDIIYAKTWEWFNDLTLTTRKRKGLSSTSSSISQEGEDTLFTIPLFLASGVDEAYLEEMMLKSKETPGSRELVKTLQASGALVVGITTAPQEPYRRLVSQTGLLEPSLLIGSPFPLDAIRQRLQETELLSAEIDIVRRYLEDCFEIIDGNSDIRIDRDVPKRILTDHGSTLLMRRIQTFHNDQLGITYELYRRRQERNLMTTGKFIEAHRILGDRSKVAVSQLIARKYLTNPGSLVTIGDGLNDTLMLQQAPISFGVNGPEAAKAATIGVITDNMRNLIPMLELIQTYAGQIDIDKLIEYGNSYAGPYTFIHRGGPNISASLINEHRTMKKRIRAKHLIY